jgi:ribosomal-protein-alanine N-acetyltransferase
MQTERLRLREWDAHYARLLDQHCNNSEVLKHLEGRCLTPAEHRDLVKWLKSQQRDYGITVWAVELKDNDDFLGFCGLVKADEPDSIVLGATEIGWRFRADQHRQGFATEAAAACMHYAFEVNGNDSGFRNVCEGLRVVSRTTRANEPSWRLMRKLGMKYDPRLDYTPAKGGDPLIVHVMTYADWDLVKRRVRDTRIR